VRFDEGSQLADLLSTKEVYEGKGDAKVDCGKGDVDTECVPAVRLYEVF